MYKKIMVALDGHPAALTALGHAQALAQAFATEIRLVSVEWPRSPTGQEWKLEQTAYLDKKRRELEAYLEGWSARLQAQGCEVSSCVLPLGSPSDRLIEETLSWGADLLILCSHGRRGISRWLLGSVAEEMNRKAECAVMIIPSPRRVARKRSGRISGAATAAGDPLRSARLLSATES